MPAFSLRTRRASAHNVGNSNTTAYTSWMRQFTVQGVAPLFDLKRGAMLRRPSAEEIKQLQAGWKPKAKRKAVVLVASEREIQDGCIKLLELDGWRIVVTDPAHVRGLGVSEPGIADTLCIRYRVLPRIFKLLAILIPPQIAMVFQRLYCEVVWIEWKRPKRSKTQQNQHDWHHLERVRGALTWKAGEQFEPTIEGFVEHYNASGLAVKRMTVGAVRR